MEKEELQCYEKAFLIVEDAVGLAQKLVKDNVKALDVANTIERRIIQLGGKPAWPINISINEISAHYTPTINDSLVFKKGDLVKVDIGAHVNGYICDRAFTVCIDKTTHPLIEASEKALENALNLVKPNVKISEISKVIEKTVNEFKFNVIRNLAGHKLERYKQHAQPSIPNCKTNMQDVIESGNVYAIEVFVTNGSGLVTDSSPTVIFQYEKDSAVRLWEARKILELSKTEFEKLPFTQRWIEGISPLKIDLALRQLMDTGALIEFPPLKEESNGLVAVTEKSVIVK